MIGQFQRELKKTRTKPGGGADDTSSDGLPLKI
jgi:hypothetical protein